MKNQVLLFIILLMSSCTTVDSNTETKPTINKEFQDFSDSFKNIELPYTISDDKSGETERITYENSVKYLDVSWIDKDSGIPDSEILPVGKFTIEDSIHCLVYRSLGLPVGSGDHIIYKIASFNNSGKRIDQTKIAEFTSWDGGYAEQTCTIGKDFKVIAQHEFENETENKKGNFKIQITNNKGVFKTESSAQNTSPENIIEPIEAKSIDYKELGKYAYPDIIKKDLSGQFAKGFQWTDKLGGNYLIATTKSSESRGDDIDEDAMDYYLYVKHYVDTGEKFPKVLWKTTDYVKGCSFDNMLAIVDESFSITDLDSDNIAETIYMYTVGCVSDVSPYPLKLIMHEDEDKMAIRGMIRMDMEGYETKSDYEIDEASFEGKPKIFKDFAKQHWLKNEVVSY